MASEYLLEKLKQYGASDFYPLHMPGHKRKISHFGNPFAIDVTEINGFDDLHHARGILLEAQRRAASLYGAEETYYLVNGSTCGILAAVAASTARGGRILMARNSHMSCYHAVFLNDLRATYLYPPVCAADIEGGECSSMDAGDRTGRSASAAGAIPGICGGIRPEDVREALRQNPDIQTVFVTSPTYDGVVSDIGAIAEAAHEAGAVLIVDEAHGAHFGMHPYFPERALARGADIVINSLHKTLPSLTQTALLHVQGSRVDRKKLREYLNIYQSSSPSYVLMAGMDACIRLLEERGDELFDAFAERLERMRSELRQGLRILRILRPAYHEAYDFDRSKVLISTERCAMTGPELAGILRGRYHLEPEMAAANYVTAIMTVADTQEGFDRLTEALLAIDGELTAGPDADLAAEPDADLSEKSDVDLSAGSGVTYPVNEEVLSIWQAHESLSEQVLLSESAGRVSAAYVFLYPPGIPLLVPGERISEELLQRLQEEKNAGLKLRGTVGSAGEKIEVVKISGRPLCRTPI